MADASKCCQKISKGWFLLCRVPGAIGELKEAMTFLMEPHDHKAIENERHRSSSFHRLGKAVGGIFQTEKLLAAFKCAFDGPAPGISGRHLAIHEKLRARAPISRLGWSSGCALG